jgi:hypothetical protein
LSKQKNGQYRYSVSGKKFQEVPPRFSDRPFFDLIDLAFKDQKVVDDTHEIWSILAEGSTK